MGDNDSRINEVISNLQVNHAKHEVRLTALEKLVENQTNVLKVIEKRMTVIGTVLILVIGASSEQGGVLLRSVMGL